MSVDNDYCRQLSVCNGVGMRKSEKTDYHRYGLESKDIEVTEAQYIRHSLKILCMWAESDGDGSHSYAEHFPLQSSDGGNDVCLQHPAESKMEL